jgi:hypothetical protein
MALEILADDCSEDRMDAGDVHGQLLQMELPGKEAYPSATNVSSVVPAARQFRPRVPVSQLAGKVAYSTRVLFSLSLRMHVTYTVAPKRNIPSSSTVASTALMELYKPSPTLGEPPKSSGRSGGKGFP